MMSSSIFERAFICVLARATLLFRTGDLDGAARLAGSVRASPQTSHADLATAVALMDELAGAMPTSRLRLLRKHTSAISAEEELARIATEEPQRGASAPHT